MMLGERISLTEESGQTMAEYAVRPHRDHFAIITAFDVLSGAIASSLDNAVNVIKGVS